MAALVLESGLVALVPEHGSCRGVGHLGGSGQDLLHPVVGGKGLALLDADGREDPAQLGLEHLDRLAIDDGVELFIEVVIRGVNSVECLPGGVEKLRRRRIRCLGQGVDFQSFPEQLAGEVRLAVLEEASRDEPVHPAG